jgi:hypothetical protein
MEKYELLINKLRNSKPKIQDSESLTENIMQMIEKKSFYSVPRFMIWVRTVFSSAAVLLLGLFIFQQNGSAKSISGKEQAYFIETRINIDSINSHGSTNDQTKIINAYLSYLQENSQKNSQLKRIYKLYNN